MAKYYGTPGYSLLHAIAHDRFSKKNERYFEEKTRHVEKVGNQTTKGCAFLGCGFPIILTVGLITIAEMGGPDLGEAIPLILLLAAFLSPFFFVRQSEKKQNFKPEKAGVDDFVSFDSVGDEVDDALGKWLQGEDGDDSWVFQQYPAKCKGMLGELLTAKALHNLPEPIEVLHDLVVTEPGSGKRILANIDHYVLTPHGSVMVDSKNWSHQPIIAQMEEPDFFRVMDKKTTSAIFTCAWEQEEAELKPAGLILSVSGEYGEYLQGLPEKKILVKELLNPRTGEIQKISELGFMLVAICHPDEVNECVTGFMEIGRDYLEFKHETRDTLMQGARLEFSDSPKIDLSASVTSADLRQEKIDAAERERRKEEAMRNIAVLAASAYVANQFRKK